MSNVVVNKNTKEITITYSDNSTKTFSIEYLYNNMYNKQEIDMIFVPLEWEAY
jgi:hypothetical protein